MPEELDIARKPNVAYGDNKQGFKRSTDCNAQNFTRSGHAKLRYDRAGEKICDGPIAVTTVLSKIFSSSTSPISFCSEPVSREMLISRIERDYGKEP